MNVRLCNTTVFDVFELIRKKRKHTLMEEEAIAVFQSEDYMFEFHRYGKRILFEEFIAYFLIFETLETNEIENEDLRIHHSYWLDLYSNLDRYQKEINDFFNEFQQEDVIEACYIAKNGFPKQYVFPDCKLVFTCGIGQSYGYPYENGMHFDILQLIKDKKTVNFKETIAHEMHHLIFNRNIKEETNDLLGYFLQCFAGEGLAIHFTNNAGGVLAKKFNEALPENIGIDAFSMNYLNHHFEETFKEFKQILFDIHNQKIQTMDEINELIFGYWLDCYIEGQTKEEAPKLKQSRLYSLGNELWGVIYDIFGMDVLYEIVNHPSSWTNKWNEAMHILGKEQYRIHGLEKEVTHE